MSESDEYFAADVRALSKGLGSLSKRVRVADEKHTAQYHGLDIRLDRVEQAVKGLREDQKETGDTLIQRFDDLAKKMAAEQDTAPIHVGPAQAANTGPQPTVDPSKRAMWDAKTKLYVAAATLLTGAGGALLHWLASRV